MKTKQELIEENNWLKWKVIDLKHEVLRHQWAILSLQGMDCFDHVAREILSGIDASVYGKKGEE